MALIEGVPTFYCKVGGERLLSDIRRCLVKQIVIGCCVGHTAGAPEGVKDVIKQARRAAA